jgi:hypothetical protein
VQELTARGFTVELQPFEFSAAPGTWGTPFVALLVALLVGEVAQLAVIGAPFAPFATWVAGAVTLWAFTYLLANYGVLRMPLMRRTGVNILAMRGGYPGVWLTAHLDTKSQPIPTLVRTVAFFVLGASVVLSAVLSASRFFGVVVDRSWWTGDAIAAGAGALPLLLCFVGNRSPGAFDNASGVATVMEAVRQLDLPQLGVLITDAEELGLAGARASGWDLRGRMMLNCDGVDDDGDVVVMWSVRPPAPVLETIRRAGASCGVPVTMRRMLPGILTDSVAFADAGAVSVTFSRGTWWSLARVHSARDDLSRLRGTGIAVTAAVLAETARGLPASPTYQWKS